MPDRAPHVTFLLNPHILGFPGALPPPGLNSDYAFVRNFDTGQVYYSKSPDTQAIPVSITKLMTALIVLRNKRAALSDTVTIQSGDLLGGSFSSMGLLAGDVITFTDLLYGMLLPSGGDAAQAAGRVVGDLLGGVGGRTRFIAEMNAVAAELGMTGTAFTNTYGNNEAGHYATARDITSLMDEVLSESILVGIISTSIRTVAVTGANARTLFLSTTNPILEDGGIIGGKDGTWVDTTPDPDLLVYNLTNCWQAPNGQKIVITTLDSNGSSERQADQRVIIGQLVLDFPALAIATPSANGAGKVLLEDGSSRVLLEDGSSFLLLEG